MNEIILTFFIGILASIVSGISGGGGGLISAPFFILIGLPPQIAVATTKLGVVGLTLGSITRFWKTDNIQWKYIIPFIAISIIAAIVGTRLLLTTDGEIIRKLVSVFIFVGIPFLFLKDIGLKKVVTSQAKKLFGYIIYFIIYTLQAAFGAGIGMTLSLVLMSLFGFTALEANATKRIPGLVLSVIALIIYMLSGVIYYAHGLAMFGGMLLGGYLGSHIAIKKGNYFIKIALSLVLVLLGLKLLF